MDFNPAQRSAIETDQGALLVLAGPGTGKTRVIISKIERLVSQRAVPAERILALTFSNRATEEMRERLAARRSDLAERVEISTIHAWCLDLLSRHAFRLGFAKTPRLMTEAQTQLFFRQLAFQLPLEPFLKTAHLDSVLGPLLELFSQCKDQGLWPEDLIQYGAKTGTEWEALGDVFNAYQARCQQRGYIDFGDAILFALRLLQEHETVRTEVQSTYDVVLIDEFQDTNWSQIELLKLIRKDSTHICAVGDDDQSIYRFRGASYSAFKFFEEAFSDLKVVELMETYRLSPSIARTASTLIRANGARRYRADKTLKPHGSGVAPVCAYQYVSFEDEALSVAEQIAQLLKEGTDPSQIAVLVRSLSHAQNFLKEAARQNILVHSSHSETLLDQPIIRDILSFLKLLQNPRSAVDLLRLLDSPFLGLPADEIYAFCRWAQEQRAQGMDLLEKLDSAPSTLSATTREKLKAFNGGFKEVLAHAARRTLSETLTEFWAMTKIVQRLMTSQGEDDLKKLARFHAQVFEWEQVQDRRDALSLLPLLEALFEHELHLDTQDAEKDPKKISLMTIHASKGLEFDHVFVLSLVGRRFPANFQKPTWQIPAELLKDEPQTKEAHIDEERRLLYVAMTRARHSLSLTTIDKKGTKPSLFLSADLKLPLSGSQDFVWREVPARSLNELLEAQITRPFERSASASTAITSARSEKPLTLSFTQIDRFERCPQAYWFEYELKIPTLPSASLAFGSAVHDALEMFFKERIKNGVPPQSHLVKAFEEAYEQELHKNPHLPQELKALGAKQLADYYDSFHRDFPKPLALEEKFRIQIGEHFVVGKIDRADQEPEGIVIVDYKTGKAKSSEDEKDQKFADESLQFSIYALAAKEFFKWSLKELKFQYLSDNSTLKTTRNNSQMDETRQKILAIAQSIQSKSFTAKPSRIVCKGCDYQRICPQSEL